MNEAADASVYVVTDIEADGLLAHLLTQAAR